MRLRPKGAADGTVQVIAISVRLAVSRLIRTEFRDVVIHQERLIWVPMVLSYSVPRGGAALADASYSHGTASWRRSAGGGGAAVSGVGTAPACRAPTKGACAVAAAAATRAAACRRDWTAWSVASMCGVAMGRSASATICSASDGDTVGGTEVVAAAAAAGSGRAPPAPPPQPPGAALAAAAARHTAAALPTGGGAIVAALPGP